MAYRRKFRVKGNEVFYLPSSGHLKKAKGAWRLNRKQELVFDFAAPEEGKRRLVLSGRVVAFSRGCLLFSAGGENSLLEPQVLRLKGEFGLDSAHKLVFTLKKTPSSRGKLVFSSRWHIDRNNQIVCVCGGAKKEGKFTLRGRWQVKGGEFRYLLAGQKNALRIRPAFRTAPLVLKKDRLEFYLAAAGDIKSASGRKRFILWGRAKVVGSRFYFEIARGGRLYFEFSRSLPGRLRIKAGLRSSPLRKRTFLLELSRRLGENKLSLRLKRNRRGWGVYAGVKLKF